MKKYGNLFTKITDIENIKLAHKNASNKKQHYKEVVMVNKDVDHYCLEIKNILDNKSYTVSKYKVFSKVDKGKARELHKLPYFPDRIIQHAIMQIVEPIWKKSLIIDTYQAIKGRGVHKCAKKIESAIRYGKHTHCLQIDVKKFYPSIQNNVLKKVIRDKIKCKDTLWLLDEIINSSDGVPIGNYISQYFGNLTLSKLDHKIKETHKVKQYYRYCDDIVVLSCDKKELHAVRNAIESELMKLNLKLKENHQIYKINNRRGVDFLGVVIRKDSIRLRRTIVDNFKKVATTKGIEHQESLISYYGWIKLTGSFGLWNKYVKIYTDKIEDKTKLLPILRSSNENHKSKQ